MRLDPETIAALEWDRVRELVAGRTSSALARRTLERWEPRASAMEAREALAEVTEGMDLAGIARLPAPFVEDQAPTLRTLAVQGSALDGRSLIDAARTLEGTRRFARFLRQDGGRWPRLAERFRAAPEEVELEKRILEAFDPDTRLVDGASPKLRALRTEVRSHRAALVDRLSRLIARLPHVLVAADSRPTFREGRYLVPLRREALGEVPGIVHDESASGATVFLEPHEVVERNNDLRRAELAVGREEERILRELTAALAERRGELELAARLALHAETVLARARYAVSTGGQPPELGGDVLELRGARHPLLVERLEEQGGEIVPLDLELEEDERALVISGPNTGGKTVLLKTVGTVVLMAQSGMVPPVGAGTRLPWHDSVYADIGDTQSIAQDLSTFTAHLTRLKAALDGAGPGTLILIDEIGASTDPAEGAALAAALIEAWTARRARTIVTTHYHMLKISAARAAGMVNGSLAYDLERNEPLYRFVKGVPGRSFGLELASRWGIEPAVLARARASLDSGARDLDEVTRRLAEEEGAFVEARRALEDERQAIGQAESARARKIADEASQRREAAEHRLGELEARITRMRDEMRRQQRKLRERAAELSEAEAGTRAAQALAEELAGTAEVLRAEREALIGQRDRPPIERGDRVRIPRYDVVGDVVSLSRTEDTCAVQAGQVRITCRMSELEIVQKAADRTIAGEPAVERPPDAQEDGAPLPLEIDLRGLSADEVGYPLAGALERAYHTGRPVIRFIHGKGTGVLRRRVAELLEKHPYVHGFRLGHWNEGGDGVTIATLAPEESREESA
ncbi:MAG TPA: Smr/MutS family protein [Gemmatimonadota bacterium]|nr:Smr/MutS family protein [Gemmatimonadota bacterium]